jgi:dolichyl-phosphate beta-glucosyltransferase
MCRLAGSSPARACAPIDGMQPPDELEKGDSPAERLLPLVVVPCYNEAQRLDIERFGTLAGSERIRLLFVNDGSTDDTGRVLATLARSSNGVDVLELPRNVGKAEAVRLGLVSAVVSGAPIVGYYDADLATPPHELLRLLDILEAKPDLSVVTAARVALLGRDIVRRATRHYLGRFFATGAAIVLRQRIYDTQCGAKLFRVTPSFIAATARPFRSSWIFDVELIGRLLRGSDSAEPVPASAFEEIPLREWHHVPGSKLGFRQMTRALFDLLMLEVQLNRRPGRPSSGRRGS